MLQNRVQSKKNPEKVKNPNRKFSIIFSFPFRKNEDKIEETIDKDKVTAEGATACRKTIYKSKTGCFAAMVDTSATVAASIGRRIFGAE